MPAKDIFHSHVVEALKKDGWTITHDPLSVPGVGLADFHIDLGAEKMIGAEKGDLKIAVEIKSFVGHSFSQDFHEAIGQFINYEVALEAEEPERILFLAIPEENYLDQFETQHVRRVIEKHHLRLMIFDPNQKSIVLWKR